MTRHGWQVLVMRAERRKKASFRMSVRWSSGNLSDGPGTRTLFPQPSVVGSLVGARAEALLDSRLVDDAAVSKAGPDTAAHTPAGTAGGVGGSGGVAATATVLTQNPLRELVL